LACGLATLFMALAAPAHAERRVALVIGNNDYKFVPKLQKAVNDARTMGATLKQLGEELTSQRQGLVADLEHAATPTAELLTQTRAALDAGTQMSGALQTTIQSFDALVGHMKSRDESAPQSAPVTDTQETQPGKPFDIADYGEVATHLGAAAHELTALLSTLDSSLPQLQRALDESAERADRTVDLTLRRAMLYGMLLIGAAALAVLLVRRISISWLSKRALKAAN